LATGVLLMSMGPALARYHDRGATVLATLGKRELTERDFRHYVRQFALTDSEQDLDTTSPTRTALLRRYLDAVALEAKARQLGLEQRPEYRAAMALLEVKLLAHFHVEQHRDTLQNVTPVTPAQLAAEYDAHPEQFQQPPKFSARELLVLVKGNPAFPERGLSDAAAKRRAQQALTELRRGLGWENVTARYSDDLATRDRGGLVSDAEFGHRSAAVEAALRQQPLGVPGELLRTELGYHVVQVLSRQLTPQRLPLDAVRLELEQRCLERQREERHDAYLREARAAVGLQRLPDAERAGGLLEHSPLPEDAALAHLGQRTLTEADFRWFVRDAVLPSRRRVALAEPGARGRLLQTFLDQEVLAELARREGVPATSQWRRALREAQESLRADFVRQAEPEPPMTCSASAADRLAATESYLERLRQSVGLRQRVPSEE